MLAHQHLRAPRFASHHRLENSVMVVVPAANVVIFEHHDVAARRYRHVMADPDHFAEHAVAGGGQQTVVKITVDIAIDGEVAGFKRSTFQQLVAGGERALDDLL